VKLEVRCRPLNNGWGYNYPDERDEPEDIDEPENENE